jgi:hypothetical protein
MFTLTLLRLSPIPKQAHLIAVLIGALAYMMDNFAMPVATTTTSFETAILAAVCWYVYKLFDGITYDGTETSTATVIGLLLNVAICAAYFLI